MLLKAHNKFFVTAILLVVLIASFFVVSAARAVTDSVSVSLEVLSSTGGGGIPGCTVNCEPTPITDVCPNIEGTQASVPSGMILENGQCVAQPTETDVCPNIDGIQSSVPGGMILENGQCVIPQIILQEICGDGADNNGNGQIDEGCQLPPPPPIISDTGGEGETGGGGSGGGGGEGVIQDLIETVVPIKIEQRVEPVEKVVRDATEAVTKAVTIVRNVVSRAAPKIAGNVEAFVKSPSGQRITAVVQPLGAAAGIVVVGSQTFAATAMIGSLSDLYLFLIRFIGFGFGIFRRKRQPWGTVYDAITKRPLDPAYVVIKRPDGMDISDAITDLDGRYGFLLPPGTYLMEASKTHYRFPSQKLVGQQNDELYTSLYFGEPIVTQEGEVIVRNIPLDPVDFDWNEFAKNKEQLFRLYSHQERTRGRAYRIFYVIGFLAALVTTLFDLRPYNFIFLSLYAALTFYQVFILQRHKAVTLKYDTGDAIPFSIVHIMIKSIEHPVKSVVTDRVGRFYALVAPGSYYVVVQEKQLDGSYREIYRSAIIEMPTGMFKEDIVIPRIEANLSQPPSQPTEPPMQQSAAPQELSETAKTEQEEQKLSTLLPPLQEP